MDPEVKRFFISPANYGQGDIIEVHRETCPLFPGNGWSTVGWHFTKSEAIIAAKILQPSMSHKIRSCPLCP